MTKQTTIVVTGALRVKYLQNAASDEGLQCLDTSAVVNWTCSNFRISMSKELRCANI